MLGAELELDSLDDSTDELDSMEELLTTDELLSGNELETELDELDSTSLEELELTEEIDATLDDIKLEELIAASLDMELAKLLNKLLLLTKLELEELTSVTALLLALEILLDVETSVELELVPLPTQALTLAAIKAASVMRVGIFAIHIFIKPSHKCDQLLGLSLDGANIRALRQQVVPVRHSKHHRSMSPHK